MKQITEDYCSFEISKLLKEKGFDEHCGTAYTTTEGFPIRIMGSTYSLEKNSDYDEFHYSMPSQSLVLKWLREEHKIHIDVFIGSDESYDADGVMVDEWHFWTYYITNTSGDMIYDAYNEVDVIEYQTHEEAVEAALSYVLKNLI